MFVSSGKSSFEIVSTFEPGPQQGSLDKIEAFFTQCAAFLGGIKHIMPQPEYLPSVLRQVAISLPHEVPQGLVGDYLSPVARGFNEEGHFVASISSAQKGAAFFSVFLNGTELIGHTGASSALVRSSDSVFLKTPSQAFGRVVFGGGRFFVEDRGKVTCWIRNEAALCVSGQTFNSKGVVEAMKVDPFTNRCVIVSRNDFEGVRITLFDSACATPIWTGNSFLQEGTVEGIDFWDQTTLLTVCSASILIGPTGGQPRQIEHPTQKSCANHSFLFAFDHRGVATVFSLPTVERVVELNFAHVVKAAYASPDFLVTLLEGKECHFVLFTEIGTWHTHGMYRTQRFSGAVPQCPEMECVLDQNQALTVVWGGNRASRFTYEAPVANK